MYNLEINDTQSKNRITLFSMGYLATYELIMACSTQKHINIDVYIHSLDEKVSSKEFIGKEF